MTSHDDDLLLQLLCCPRCGGELAFGDELICSDCRAQYPRVGGLPCLFPEPEAALGEWRTRLSSVVAELESQASRYRAAITDDVTRATTRSRLKLLGGAYSDHARRLKALLSPLGVSEAGAAVETYRALSGTELPGSQGLIGYYANLHRDWCWGEAENEAAFDIVDAALGSNEPGRMLVLGAGAGRLAYKLRRRRKPEILVAADINPLMLLVAAKMIAGESLELYEFPVAPRDLDSHAILRTLQAPEPVENGLQLILADVSRGPFAPGGFDTIVTPWLVDILAEDFSTFARRINTWLKPDGRWVNSGSLVFQHADAKRCYSTEEVRELIGEAGFKSANLQEDRQPYLQSPASRHGRIESVVTWSVRKEQEAVMPDTGTVIPKWIENPDLPVPLLPEFSSRVLAMRVYAYVASLIDGQRSLQDIAKVLVEERLMTPEEAAPAVRGFLLRLHEESLSPGSC